MSIIGFHLHLHLKNMFDPLWLVAGSAKANATKDQIAIQAALEELQEIWTAIAPKEAEEIIAIFDKMHDVECEVMRKKAKNKRSKESKRAEKLLRVRVAEFQEVVRSTSNSIALNAHLGAKAPAWENMQARSSEDHKAFEAASRMTKHVHEVRDRCRENQARVSARKAPKPRHPESNAAPTVNTNALVSEPEVIIQLRHDLAQSIIKQVHERLNAENDASGVVSQLGSSRYGSTHSGLGSTEEEPVSDVDASSVSSDQDMDVDMDVNV